MGRQPLFEHAPEGFRYLPGVITEAEEQRLVRDIESLSFSDVRMHGIVAKRRVAHFGWVYGYQNWTIVPGPPMPDFLREIRARAAALAGLDPETFVQALVTRYPPGASIGWHRDAPMFGPVVIGLSFLSSCRFRFQRQAAGGRETFAQTIEPRSAYLLSGPARFDWQHSIPATTALRYSVTLRTLAGGDSSDRPAA